jgi:hypothetical protein
MRILVEPPPSSCCEFCGGELRLKLIESANPAIGMDHELFVCVNCEREQLYLVSHHNGPTRWPSQRIAPPHSDQVDPLNRAAMWQCRRLGCAWPALRARPIGQYPAAAWRSIWLRTNPRSPPVRFCRSIAGRRFASGMPTTSQSRPTATRWWSTRGIFRLCGYLSGTTSPLPP